MRRRQTMLALVTALAVAAGCSGDVGTTIKSNAELRDKVMAAFAGNGELAGQMTDRLLATDSTRAIVIDRLFSNGSATEAMLARVARDRTKFEGVLRLAVQDSAMKTHVLTLLRGMEMGAAGSR
jgi:hypothetical protein